MNLKKLLKDIGKMGISQRCCNFSAAGTSLDQMNPKSVDYYPILFNSPTGNHRVRENTTEYEITLYWIDRLLEDSSNDIDIFSNSIEQLKNIIIGIRTINGVVDVSDEYTIKNFTSTEAMNDRVAGSYATIQVTVANDTICYIEGEDISLNEI